jgi:hypothetical protein
VILVFRLLSWAEKYQTPYPKLLAVAGILAAGLILVLSIVSAYVGRDRTYSKR